MNKNRIIIIVLFLLVGIIGFGSQVLAAGETYYLDEDCCGLILGNPDLGLGDTGDTFILTADLGECAGHGLVVGADNITIDGNNHTITGDRGVLDFGINNADGYDNITIENFSNINNFMRGINLSNCTGSTIQNNVINSVIYGGIVLTSSSLNNILSNTINDTTRGIYITSSSSNTFTGNTTNSNLCGFYFTSSSSSNTLTGNTMNLNRYYGIYLSSSSSNNIGLEGNGNIISRNEVDIYNSSSSNTYYSNQFNHNRTISRMITFDETEDTRTKNVGNTINFDISMFDPNEDSCSTCSYTYLPSRYA